MKKYFTYVVLVLLLGARFALLDQDAPSYFISGISQEDEAYYSIGAIHRFNVNEKKIIPNEAAIVHEGFVTDEGLSFYSTPLTFLSLELFGNNYYGLRVPVVLLSILTILMLWGILKKIKVKDSTVHWLLVLYAATDFYFFIFSRFQTPQIYSIFIITLTLWFYFRYGAWKAWPSFILGVLACSSVTFFYVYNLFFFFAFCLFMLWNAWSEKKLSVLFFFCAGAVISFGLYLLCLAGIGSGLNEVLAELSGHARDNPARFLSNDFFYLPLALAKGIRNSFLAILNTNLFRFNLGFLLLFLVLLFSGMIRFYKGRNPSLLLLLFCLIGIFVQNVFVSTYLFKKLVVLMPIAFCVVAYQWDYFFYERGEFAGNKKKLVAGGVVLCLLFCLNNFRVNKNPVYWSGFDYGYFENTGATANFLNILGLVIVFCLISLAVFNRKMFIKFQYGFFILLIPQVFLVMNYCFSKEQFAVRDSLVSMKENYSGKIAVTGFVHANQFYSGIIPVLNPYLEKFGKQRASAIADSLLSAYPGSLKIIKYFNNDKRLRAFHERDVFVRREDYSLIVSRIIHLPYYNYMILQSEKPDSTLLKN